MKAGSTAKVLAECSISTAEFQSAMQACLASDRPTCLAVQLGVSCELMCPASIEGSPGDSLDDAIAADTDLHTRMSFICWAASSNLAVQPVTGAHWESQGQISTASA